MRRVWLAGVLGGLAVAAIATNVPYWNWYGFPGNYTAASMLVQVVGFIAVGLFAARIVRADESAPRIAERV